LCELYSEGKEICENLTFLGSSGVKNIQDIKIAFISRV
jgi:hypothetical protein